MAEEYFHFSSDPQQINMDEENTTYIYEHFPECLKILKRRGKVIGYTLSLPCNRSYMNAFLKGDINERELFAQIKTNVDLVQFDSVYLCAAYVHPDYRRRGLALKSMTDSVKRLVQYRNDAEVTLFYWAFSEEGRGLAEKVGQQLHAMIFLEKFLK